MNAPEPVTAPARTALEHLEMLGLLVLFRVFDREALPRRLAWATRIGGLRSGPPAEHPPLPQRTHRLAARCGHLVPGARCLHRALAIKAFLGRRGTDSTLVFGLHPDPTTGGHAWVEVGGVPVEPIDPARYGVIFREAELRSGSREEPQLDV